MKHFTLPCIDMVVIGAIRGHAFLNTTYSGPPPPPPILICVYVGVGWVMQGRGDSLTPLIGFRTSAGSLLASKVWFEALGVPGSPRPGGAAVWQRGGVVEMVLDGLVHALAHLGADLGQRAGVVVPQVANYLHLHNPGGPC